METTDKATRVAVLIDAENVVASHADILFSRSAAMGEIVAREIFGTAAALTAWVAPVLKYAIHPNLTIRASKGKNSSDIALVIGAMDLLLMGGVDTIVIASSDSDFSALSVRLRNAGVNVVGMGMEKSNPLWRAACTSFEVLDHPASAPKADAAAAEPAGEPAQEQPRRGAQARKQGRAASPTHRERVAVIGQFIQKRLDSNGGRIQVGSLFTGLNKLPEYKTDQQNSGRRPLNYLSSTFAEVFQFVNSADGKTWVSRAGDDPLPPGAEPAGDAVNGEEPAIDTAGGEEPAVIEETAPLEDAGAEPSAAAADNSEGEEEDAFGASDLAERLAADGMDADDARRAAEVFASAANLRAAYNELRRMFGNAEGRACYNRVKAILDEFN